MPYAVEADITDAYGAQALVVADRDGDGVADSAAMTAALDWSAATVDSYLRNRYPLPLLNVPADIKGAAIDIALYRLAQTADMMTDEIRRRYEAALSRLQEYARGVARLPEDAVDPDLVVPGASGQTGPSIIVGTGPERLFSRDKMRDL